jgi:hypothetical protein
MYASRFVLGALALSLLVAGFGCKTGKGGKVPTASPMTSFAPPDADEILPEDDTDETDAIEPTDDAGGE